MRATLPDRRPPRQAAPAPCRLDMWCCGLGALVFVLGAVGIGANLAAGRGVEAALFALFATTGFVVAACFAPRRGAPR